LRFHSYKSIFGPLESKTGSIFLTYFQRTIYVSALARIIQLARPVQRDSPSSRRKP
jgi:hypothetical protein